MRSERKTRKLAVIAILATLALCLLVGMLARFWPHISSMVIQQDMQTRMQCWVKVVDQHNKGVIGYKCRVVEEHASLWPFSGSGDVARIFETGEDGTFEYKSKGATGRVFFGYSWGTQWALNPRQLLERNSLGVNAAELAHAIREKPTGYLGSKENPYVLNVFSAGLPQKLLYSKIRVNLKEQGNYFCIDILSGRSWESKSPEGDIALADLPPPKTWEDREAFRKKLRIVAGQNSGVVPVGDIWGLEAPQEGYLPELNWPMDWEDRKYRLDFFHFYYRLSGNHDTPRFGRLLFEIRGKVEGADIRCFTNLLGERNLFYEGYTDLLEQNIRNYVSPPVLAESGQVKAP